MLCSHSGNDAADRGEPLGLVLGLVVDELLDLAAELDRVVGVVGDAELDEDDRPVP